MKSRRPDTSLTLEKREHFLRLLAEGHTVKYAAATVGLSRETFYTWRSQDDAFKKAWEEAWEAGTQALEEEARRRAAEGVDRPVYQQGKLVGVVREYSDTLLIFLLKGRRPDVYRDRLEHSGQVGGDLRIIIEGDSAI